MEKWKWKFQNFMGKRNGLDELGRDVTIASFVIYIFYLLIKSVLLYIIAFCGIVYGIFRMFSSNVRQRQQENQIYIDRKKLYKFRFEQHKSYRFFKCKGCGKKIRVPRGKGKVEITCPICGRKIIRRT